jgi:hypothetical protein
MSSSKREHTRMERRLVACLTDACETAKIEIEGFLWLTHAVDYGRFPASLQVVWVFDTRVNKDQARSGDRNLRMTELTATALGQAGVELASIAPHVHFDSEEECQRAHGGDWQSRLARLNAMKGS